MSASSCAPILSAMRVTLVNLFRKPVTVHYPDKTRAYPDRYRGLLALVYEKDTGEEACIGCRLCEYVCPPAVIKVEMLKSEKRNYAKTLHARALRLRVLRAVRPGVPDRRHRHDEVVRHADDRSPRDAARQGSAARHRPAASSSRGRPATCCATCRARRRGASRPHTPPRRGSRAGKPAAEGTTVVNGEALAFWGLAVGARRVGARRRAVEEPVSLRCSGSRSRSPAPPACSCCSTPSSSPPCSFCSMPAASSPSSSSRSSSPSGWSASASRRPAGASPAARSWLVGAARGCIVSAVLAAAAGDRRGRRWSSDLTRIDRRDGADAVRAAVRAARRC